MRAEIPIATGTWYHVMSRDITQCHDLTVPKLSQRPLSRRAAHDPIGDITRTRLIRQLADIPNYGFFHFLADSDRLVRIPHPIRILLADSPFLLIGYFVKELSVRHEETQSVRCEIDFSHKLPHTDKQPTFVREED